MTTIEKIKAEIERRLKECKWQDGRIKPPRTRNAICYDELSELLSFLSTLEENSEKPVPNDLEEAAKVYFENPENSWDVRDVFIAGAKWDREQMLGEAVEGEVMLNPYPTICLDDCKDYDFKDGDKVRIIVVKED